MNLLFIATARKDTTIKTVNDGHYDLLVALHYQRNGATVQAFHDSQKKVGPWRPPRQSRSAYPDGFPQTRLHYEDLSLIRHETEYTLEIIRHLDPELYSTTPWIFICRCSRMKTCAPRISSNDLRAPLLFVTPPSAAPDLRLPGGLGARLAGIPRPATGLANRFGLLSAGNGRQTPHPSLALPTASMNSAARYSSS